MDEILRNIERGIRDGMEKSNPVDRELKELAAAFDESIERLSALALSRTLDMPFVVMDRLVSARHELDMAAKGLKKYEEREG